MNKFISYYELLGMIKDGNIPEKVMYKEETYFWKGKRYQKTEDGLFLSDIDEIKMFEECIKIPNDDFEDIEEIRFIIGVEENDETFANKINQLINNQKKIINILKNK